MNHLIAARVKKKKGKNRQSRILFFFFLVFCSQSVFLSFSHCNEKLWNVAQRRVKLIAFVQSTNAVLANDNQRNWHLFNFGCRSRSSRIRSNSTHNTPHSVFIRYSFEFVCWVFFSLLSSVVVFYGEIWLLFFFVDFHSIRCVIWKNSFIVQ